MQQELLASLASWSVRLGLVGGPSGACCVACWLPGNGSTQFLRSQFPVCPLAALQRGPAAARQHHYCCRLAPAGACSERARAAAAAKPARAGLHVQAGC